MLFREVLRNKFEKCSADISLDVFTERRVVLDNISLSVVSRSCRLLVFVVGQCFPYSRWLSKLIRPLVWPC